MKGAAFDICGFKEYNLYVFVLNMKVRGLHSCAGLFGYYGQIK